MAASRFRRLHQQDIRPDRVTPRRDTAHSLALDIRPDQVTPRRDTAHRLGKASHSRRPLATHLDLARAAGRALGRRVFMTVVGGMAAWPPSARTRPAFAPGSRGRSRARADRAHWGSYRRGSVAVGAEGIAVRCSRRSQVSGPGGALRSLCRHFLCVLEVIELRRRARRSL